MYHISMSMSDLRMINISSECKYDWYWEISACSTEYEVCWRVSSVGWYFRYQSIHIQITYTYWLLTKPWLIVGFLMSGIGILATPIYLQLIDTKINALQCCVNDTSSERGWYEVAAARIGQGILLMVIRFLLPFTMNIKTPYISIYIYRYIQRLKNQSTINLTGCWIVTV